MILVQITDPHLSVEAGELWGGYEPDFAFAAVLEAVARLVPQPDLVLFTGDLTETGAPAEYANFLRLAGALPLRKAAIPGNHDRHAAFATALAGTDVAIGTLPRLHLVIDDLPLRVIALDSVADGESRGRLDPADLDWLAAQLDAAPERETAVFLHHPPFANGIPFSDREICRGADGLGALLARHPQVIGLGSGHVHRAVRTMVGGVPAWIAPSVAWEVPLDLSPDAGPRLTPQNPAFMVHVHTPGAPLVSHAAFLPGLF